MYWLFCYCYLLLLLAFVIVSVTILNNQQSISIRGIYPYSALRGRGSSINAWYSFLLCFLSLCFNKYLVWYWILYLIPRVSDLLLSVFIIPFSLSLSFSLSLFFFPPKSRSFYCLPFPTLCLFLLVIFVNWKKKCIVCCYCSLLHV